MAPEKYFLITYDLRAHKVVVEDFGNDFDRAVGMYSMLEERHTEDERIEVVLVGADSIETIHKTHSHYFAETADDLLEQFLVRT
jgi:DNA-binding protein